MTININIDTNESLNISVNQHHIPTWVYANSQTEHELKRIRLAQHQRQKQEELQQQHLRQLRLQRERQAREKAKKALETKKQKKQLNSQYGYKAQKRHQKQDDGPEL